jgi:hypothetical protein
MRGAWSEKLGQRLALKPVEEGIFLRLRMVIGQWHSVEAGISEDVDQG